MTTAPSATTDSADSTAVPTAPAGSDDTSTTTLDLRIEAVPSDCASAGPIEPGGGEHGRYRTIDDVADPIDVEDVATALGPAVLFTQQYDGVEEALAIVTLDDPVDPVDPVDPTIAIRSDDGDFGREELRAMLATLDPPGGLFDPDHAAMDD